MTSPLIIEWQTLQNNYEQHEKSALLIKLASLTFFLLGLAISQATLWAILIVLLCWGLESVIKTYQSRLGERLLKIEAAIKNKNESEGMQFHTGWQINRPSGMRLIIEYGAQSLKPTIAFPYAIILLASIARHI